MNYVGPLTYFEDIKLFIPSKRLHLTEYPNPYKKDTVATDGLLVETRHVTHRAHFFQVNSDCPCLLVCYVENQVIKV